MTRFPIWMLFSHARLALSRLGAIRCAACVLLLASMSAWVWGIPALQAQLSAQQEAARIAEAALAEASLVAPVAQPTLPEERLAQFFAILGDKRYQEQQVKSLFAIAGKTGLLLRQAEYKPSFEKNGGFHTYQVNLPVKGSYVAVRQFSEQTLLAIPFASLDEMHFKRESIGAQTLEAQLRFTLYLQSGTPDSGSPSHRKANDA